MGSRSIQRAPRDLRKTSRSMTLKLGRTLSTCWSIKSPKVTRSLIASKSHNRTSRRRLQAWSRLGQIWFAYFQCSKCKSKNQKKVSIVSHLISSIVRSTTKAQPYTSTASSTTWQSRRSQAARSSSISSNQRKKVRASCTTWQIKSSLIAGTSCETWDKQRTFCKTVPTKSSTSRSTWASISERRKLQSLWPCLQKGIDLVITTHHRRGANCDSAMSTSTRSTRVRTWRASSPATSTGSNGSFPWGKTGS